MDMENTHGHHTHLYLSTYMKDWGFELNTLRIPTLGLEDKHKASQMQTDKESLTLRKTKWLEQMYPSCHPLSGY